MEAVILDTNVLIEILKGNQDTINVLNNLKVKFKISSITEMELYYGAKNKQEQFKLEKFISLFEIIHINTEISKKSISLIKKYAKSHNLDIPDSLIASTALMYHCKLFTYNKKDFRYINGLILI